ncbi:Lysine 2,3-aminomutase related protein [Candidatus Magnetomoraceae bacterium gMMP-15]
MKILNFYSDIIVSSKSDFKYKAYTLKNFKQIPQIQKLSNRQKFAIEIVGRVLPFKTNNYVVNKLINWDDIPNDPIFILNFPQEDMLSPEHFDKMANLIKNCADKEQIKKTANQIRMQLNPHPAGQLDDNVPLLNGVKLMGMQHKYDETVLFFPSKGQTCHAYCSFCFRWPQFSGIDKLKFAMNNADRLIKYIRQHNEVSDILFTGGDPLVMKAKAFASYINPILKAKLPNIATIRIGTKALGYWPYKFLTDPDSEDLLSLFRKIIKNGKNLSIMAHFNHSRELATEVVKKAISRIRETGAQIRTQSPLLNHINNKSEIWSEMWKQQVKLGCIPYYMFLPRNTGAQDYFSVPITKAWNVYRKAYRHISGLARTVRGPSMSAGPGKIQILGVGKIHEEKVLVLRFLQGRKSEWVGRPFFAKYDEKAIWLDELKPAFGEDKFFFEKEIS